MRLPIASPLIACLVVAHVVADSFQERKSAQVITQARHLDSLVKKGHESDNAAVRREESVVDSNSKPKGRTYKGTEDAPVDGLDGKPHAGPFVDTTPDLITSRPDISPTDKTKPKSKSLAKFEETAADIPQKNDGVMNDENRVTPKKGTTGTEGGVSERAKDRKAKGNQEIKPQGPVAAPPLPHSEQEKQEKSQKEWKAGSGKQDMKGESKDGTRMSVKDSKKEVERGAGGLGLEKPKDLPEKPHNLPHPNPRSPSGKRTSSPGGTNNGWLHDTMPYTEDPGLEPHDLWSSPDSSSPVDDIEWHEWFHSFVLSLTMILFSEIGDKTFLIAALMAMRHDRMLVFSAAFSALITMTILSAVLGHAVPTLLPKRITTLLAAILFLVFGARMLREGLSMPKDSGVGEEMQEVEAELEEKEQSMARHSVRRTSVSAEVLESGRGRKHSTSNNLSRAEPSPTSSRGQSPQAKDRFAGLTNLFSLVLSPAWVQTFIMTFLGEWGDRSQIATIAMAAGQDYWWVTLGAILGHACCTGVAVIGGRALAGRVSMRVVTIGGAVAFLVFGIIYIYECAIDHS